MLSSPSLPTWVARFSAGLALLTLACFAHAEDAPRAPQLRSFEFTYGVTINGLSPQAKARIWLPVARTDHEQTVEFVEARTPSKPQFTDEKHFHNRALYLEATANDRGEIPIDIIYRVTRSELLMPRAETADKAALEPYLVPSRMIPGDGSILRKLTADRSLDGDGLPRVRALYDRVDDLMKYDKPQGQPWGRGDATWACDSRYGNCTDFHSVFIGACRDLGIPARFEMGFPIPEKRGEGTVDGYHCWAKFVHDGRWIPVDISEADKNPSLKEYYFGNLTANRVKFTEGRDLDLDPAPANGPVNFLVYPYVEVDDKVHTQFEKRFRYRDL